MASGISRKIQPIIVTPRCLRYDESFLCIEPSRDLTLLSFDARADPIPERPAAALQVPIEPDSGRFADQVAFGHEAPDAPVRAVVAIVADHEIAASRHRLLERQLFAEEAPGRSLAAQVDVELLAVAGSSGRRVLVERGRAEHGVVSVLAQH